ncbi:hypothetical protein B0J13DRAFT_607010 [Dactylonectria estremocensis]|uniref:Uncharacterized protein n=1 Tax=Dactylonectria estremocensis TaxID=1079267 RepID=A0A9P9EXP5_9HYPO|nr:hypothetical protein B0J13DRAFT_607010 [Dactylonectria estremocensis]
MGYSGYCNCGYSTEASHPGDDDYYNAMSTKKRCGLLVFFSIHLGPWNMFHPWNALFGHVFLSHASLLRHLGTRRASYPRRDSWRFETEQHPRLQIAGSRAAECADKSARLGRDDLIKTDLFSLGVTLTFLLVGNHIVNDIMALSDSDLLVLKEENKLAAWIVAHRDDTSAHIVMPTGSSDWVTDLSWNDESSIFAHYDLSYWYMSLCDRLLAADARQRPESFKTPAITAPRHMLRRNLQTSRPHSSEAASNTVDFDPSPDPWARMAALIKISNARLRKLTGQGFYPRPE